MGKVKRADGALLSELRGLIEQARRQVAHTANSTLTMLHWHIGLRIHREILKEQRASYGEEILPTLSAKLEPEYGKGFSARNLARMIKFAEAFPDEVIVATLARELSWSHIVEILPLKKPEAVVQAEISHLRAGGQMTPDMVFRDPYMLDFLGLPDGYSERDLESAILRDMERFLLELGTGFTFVARQKRITVGPDDFYLDLLFYHRHLRRLVAVELKLEAFAPAHKGQMELYLRWLDKYDRAPGEESPIGLILCAGANAEQVELMDLSSANIRVAEYLDHMPDMKVMQAQLHRAAELARERAARGRLPHVAETKGEPQ